MRLLPNLNKLKNVKSTARYVQTMSYQVITLLGRSNLTGWSLQ